MVKFFTTDGKFSLPKVAAQLLVLSALVLGVVAFTGNNKTVTLNVDGKVSSIQTFGGTVDQVVKAAKVELKPADRVTPALDASVQNGSIINVNLAKAVTVKAHFLVYPARHAKRPSVEAFLAWIHAEAAAAAVKP